MNREAVFEQLKIDEGVQMKSIKTILATPNIWCLPPRSESDPEYGQEVRTPVPEERVKECFEKDPDTAI